MSDSDELKGPKRKIGLTEKVKANSPDNSLKDHSSNFETKANFQFEKMEEYKNKIWDLSVKFKSFIESKVLPENKGPIALNLEKEVVEKLIALATNMNEDDLEDYGIGSNALCMLLMKCMLMQRDMLNKLNFEIDLLKKSNKV